MTARRGKHKRGKAKAGARPPTRSKDGPAAVDGSSTTLSGRAVVAVAAPLLLAGAALGGWWLLRGGGDGEASDDELSASPQLASLDSHDRMLALLRDIYQRTDSDNHWQGEGAAEPARRLLTALPESAEPLQRRRLLLDVAEHELRLGNLEVAIERFEAAAALARDLGEGLPGSERAEGLFRLGVAYLRWGESANCAGRHLAESCILPIRGPAVHHLRDGSERAMEAFLRVAESTPRTSPVHLKSVWLLNLAAMTLGEHPQGVPEQFRLRESAYGSDAGFPAFENVAPLLGIDSFNLSGGAVVDDFNGDGWLDLFTTTFDTRGEPHFFVNQGDGTFVDRTTQANLRGLYGGLNVVSADYDNDGDVDLYVLRGAWLEAAGRHPNSLLRNDGAAAEEEGVEAVHFTDVTFAAGLGQAHYPTQTAAWADYDNDGDVDLYVGNEHRDPVERSSQAGRAFEAPSQLFRNQGDGTFAEVGAVAGVDVRAYVKGVVWGDYDDDRFPDLYVSVLGGANRLFHNNRDGTFTDTAAVAGVSEPVQSFPVWFWDYDNDGHLDLYVSSYRGSPGGVALVAASYLGIDVPWDLARLYRGDGAGGFEDTAAKVGLNRLVLPMGSNFGDLDHDGWLDFYLGTGYPDYEAVMPNVLYHNREGRRFVDVTLAAGFGHLQKGHAVAFADVDHDGDQDLFAQMGGAFPGDRFSDALFLNPGFGHHWVALELEGTTSNRSAIGARIRVDVVEGGRRRSIYRHVGTGGSFGCNPLRQTIGLGGAAEIDQLEIYWPTSDSRHLLSDVPIDRRLRVVEGGAFEVMAR